MVSLSYEELLNKLKKGMRKGNWRKLSRKEGALYRAAMAYTKPKKQEMVRDIENRVVVEKLLALMEKRMETPGMRVFNRGFKKAVELLQKCEVLTGASSLRYWLKNPDYIFWLGTNLDRRGIWNEYNIGGLTMPGIELFGDEERKEVLDVLDTGILFRYNFDIERKKHWKTRTFEKELAEFLSVKYSHLCSSGSTAVSIALASAGIGAEDEVIVPPFTFIATIEAVLLSGAIPVFADIDETLCLSPEGIKAVITPHTKAVLLVHMCGAMAKLDEITALCKEHNLVLIEDSAQALGATYKKKSIGTFGKVGSFSFDFFKIITAGEGGAVVMNDRKCYATTQMFSDHGHDHIGNIRGAERHPILGFNYRISELNAAVGLAQFRKLKFILERQRAHKKILKDALRQFPQIRFRDIPDEDGDSATFLSFFLPDEATARRVNEGFAKAGIDGVNYWYDNNFHYIRNWEHLKGLKSAAKLPLTSYHLPQNYKNLKLPQSDQIISRLISLGIKVTWTEDELSQYIDRITEALKNIFK